MELKKHIEVLLGQEAAGKVLKAADSGLTIVVAGPQGPTGKSTLCRLLNENGYKSVEAYEMKESDNNTANIVITLNRFVR